MLSSTPRSGCHNMSRNTHRTPTQIGASALNEDTNLLPLLRYPTMAQFLYAFRHHFRVYATPHKQEVVPMRPSRIHSQYSSPIAIIAVMFLMVFSWTVILASAQDERQGGAAKKGTIETANKLAVQKYGHNSIFLSGSWYRFSGTTKFLDEAGQRIPVKAIPIGSLVNIRYITDKDTAEDYPFTPKDKVLLTIQVVQAAKK